MGTQKLGLFCWLLSEIKGRDNHESEKKNRTIKVLADEVAMIFFAL
jgi:hypothetical protein